MAKISLVVSNLTDGGVIRAFLLAQILRHLGHHPEIVGFEYGYLYAQPPEGVSVKVIKGDRYPHFLGSVRQMWPLLDGDILYALKPKPSSFGIALLRRWRTKQPLILDMDDWELSWYGGDDWSYQPTPKQLYRDIFKPNGQLRNPDHPLYVKWLEKWVKSVDALTVNAAFLLRRFGGKYLPNGKDTDLFNPTPYDPEHSRQKYNLAGYRVLMFPGAPRPHKGVEDALTALEKLNDARYRLVIVGGSPYDDYDDRLLKRWGKWLIKLPRCPVMQMPEVLAAAHVVVVPQGKSLAGEAQFPHKLTDGMAMAKPILSTQMGSIPEILADTGYLVPPNDPDAIAVTLTEIFKNWDTAQQRGQAARQRCVEQYSVHKMAIDLERILQPLLRN